MIKLPGLIDPHVHLRDPGQTHKEDFSTGTQAAIAGGFTTIIDMPNNKVPITTEKLLNEKIIIAKEKAVCDLGFYFGSLGNNFEEFQKVQDKILGLKIFLNQTTGGFIVDLRIFEKICEAWPNPPSGGKPILLHAEENILEEALKIGQGSRQKIHVCHVSSKNELKIILNAKNRGESVTCGVTPHHLFLTSDDLSGFESLANVKPFLKSKTDQDFLWQHINDIDAIESDHAPHTLEEKKNGAFGFPGLETTLPLLLTAAHNGKITIDEIIRLCHTNPAQIFGLKSITSSSDPGEHRGSREANNETMQQSNNDTFLEIDENVEWEIKNENLFTKCKWTPFNGWKIKGKIKNVTLRGTKVFKDGKLFVQSGSGRIIY